LSSTSPLVLLGFARIISTSGVDYQVFFLFLCYSCLCDYLLIIIIIAIFTDMRFVRKSVSFVVLFFSQNKFLMMSHFLFDGH
jgi:hypothetical protein